MLDSLALAGGGTGSGPHNKRHTPCSQHIMYLTQDMQHLRVAGHGRLCRAAWPI
jgi:hypothetical protein